MIRRKACAFAGHRPSKLSWRYNESDQRCMALKAVLEEQIQMQIEASTTDFLSGMAQGIDQICAELVLHQREKNPCWNQICQGLFLYLERRACNKHNNLPNANLRQSSYPAFEPAACALVPWENDHSPVFGRINPNFLFAFVY